MAIPKGKVKALKLRAVKHDMPGSLWCGPAVLSSITGRTTSVISELIKQGRYGTARDARLGGYTRSAVKGTSSGELKGVLAHYGLWLWPAESYRYKIRPGSDSWEGVPTLARWLRERSRERRADLCIVNLTGHWVAVKGNKFLDSHTKEPVWLRAAPHRSKRVKRVWIVTHAGAPRTRA